MSLGRCSVRRAGSLRTLRCDEWARRAVLDSEPDFVAADFHHRDDDPSSITMLSFFLRERTNIDTLRPGPLFASWQCIAGTSRGALRCARCATAAEALGTVDSRCPCATMVNSVRSPPTCESRPAHTMTLTQSICMTNELRNRRLRTGPIVLRHGDRMPPGHVSRRHFRASHRPRLRPERLSRARHLAASRTP